MKNHGSNVCWWVLYVLGHGHGRKFTGQIFKRPRREWLLQGYVLNRDIICWARLEDIEVAVQSYLTDLIEQFSDSDDLSEVHAL